MIWLTTTLLHMVFTLVQSMLIQSLAGKAKMLFNLTEVLFVFFLLYLWLFIKCVLHTPNNKITNYHGLPPSHLTSDPPMWHSIFSSDRSTLPSTIGHRWSNVETLLSTEYSHELPWKNSQPHSDIVPWGCARWNIYNIQSTLICPKFSVSRMVKKLYHEWMCLD